MWSCHTYLYESVRAKADFLSNEIQLTFENR